MSGTPFDLEDRLVEDVPRHVVAVHFEREVRRDVVRDAEDREGGELERRRSRDGLADREPRGDGGVELRVARRDLAELGVAVEVDVHVRVVRDAEAEAVAGLDEEARPSKSTFTGVPVRDDADVRDVHEPAR